MNKQTKVAIIGAGAAGVGMGATFEKYGFHDYLILEAGEIGESFRQWQPQTRFISPSFTSNEFGLVDLNAVTADTSPAYSLQAEHPSGPQFARYLAMVAEEYSLPILDHQQVESVLRQEDGKFLLTTATLILEADYVIFALGDFHFPNRAGIKGANLARHYAEVGDLHEVATKPATPQVIIGGNEAAVDLAAGLAMHGIESHLYTKTTAITANASDPSKRLTEGSLARYRFLADQIRVETGFNLTEIKRVGDDYELRFHNGRVVTTSKQPLLATGFALDQSPLIQAHFATDDGGIQLTDADESTTSPNAFLVGPAVRHGEAIYCYIYKYRQRFAPLAETIMRRLDLPINQRVRQFFMDYAMYGTAGVSGSCSC